MVKCLVTGGAGFIGSHLVEGLLDDGNEVIVIDNLSTGNIVNIKSVLDRIEFIEGDILNLSLLNEKFQGVDFVFHVAALPSVPRSVDDPISSMENNVVGTHNVLFAAKNAGVKRVIYSASSSAYGDSETLPKIESMQTNPLSPYAVTKLTGEYYCKAFSKVYGLETVSLRYFNVFGPRQNPSSQYSAVIPKFIHIMNQNEVPVIYGDGEHSRDFTYVKNVVKANILASKVHKTSGEVINIACGVRTSLNELVLKLNKILNLNIKPEYQESRVGDVKHSLADISLAKLFLGFSPVYTFDEGLKITVDWYLNKN